MGLGALVLQIAAWFIGVGIMTGVAWIVLLRAIATGRWPLGGPLSRHRLRPGGRVRPGGDGPALGLLISSFVVSAGVVHAAPDERLTFRHDAGSTPTPYVAGMLLAVRAVPCIAGLVRGLETVLLQDSPRRPPGGLPRPHQGAGGPTYAISEDRWISLGRFVFGLRDLP